MDVYAHRCGYVAMTHSLANLGYAHSLVQHIRAIVVTEVFELGTRVNVYVSF